MKAFRSAVAVLTLLLPACTSASSAGSHVLTPTVVPPEVSVAVEPACPAELSTPLQAWASVGFSGSIVYSGRDVDCRLGYGAANNADELITPDTVFSIGSVTKFLTQVAVIALVQEGELSVEDQAGVWIKELDGEIGSLTIRELLTHTSGLPDTHANDLDPLTQAEALEAISGKGLLFEPGEQFGYSNSGYTLLAAIVERVSGRPFRTYLVDRVLTLADGSVVGGFWNGEPRLAGPIAIGRYENGEEAQIGDFAGPHWALEGAGGVAMTADGLSRWGHAFLRGEVVSPQSVAFVLNLDGASDAPLVSVGGGDDTGHNVALVLYPDVDAVLVLASNTQQTTAEDLLAVVIPALETGTAIPSPAGAAIDVEPIGEVAGAYRFNDGSTVTLEQAGSTVVTTASGGDAIGALYPIAVDRLPDVETHEALAVAFFNGDTPEGQEELNLLREDFGLARETEVVFEIDGSGYITPDLRTYVNLTAAGESLLVWVAFDELGNLAGIDFDQPIPPRDFVATAGGELVPADSVAGNAPITITPISDGISLTNARGETIATRE